MTNETTIVELDRIHKLYNNLNKKIDDYKDLEKEKDLEIEKCNKKNRESLNNYYKNLQKTNRPKKPQIFEAIAPTSSYSSANQRNFVLDLDKEGVYIKYYFPSVKETIIYLYANILSILCAIMAVILCVVAFFVNLQIMLYAIIIGVALYIIQLKYPLKESVEYWENCLKIDYFKQTINNAFAKDDPEKFYKDFKEYDKWFSNITQQCDKHFEKEKEPMLLAVKKIESDYDSKLKSIFNSAQEIKFELDKVTIIGSEYFDRADKISDMLKSGRADTLKEALNLTLDEERKDREERARRSEAQLLAIQNQLHNMEMKRIAEAEAAEMMEHNRAMEASANAQLELAKKQEARMQEQADNERRAAEMRCLSCIYNTSCSFRTKQITGICARFKAR